MIVIGWRYGRRRNLGSLLVPWDQEFPLHFLGAVLIERWLHKIERYSCVLQRHNMTETQPWNNPWIVTANGVLIEDFRQFALPSSSSASSLSSLASISSDSSSGRKENMIDKETQTSSGDIHTPLCGDAQSSPARGCGPCERVLHKHTPLSLE